MGIGSECDVDNKDKNQSNVATTDSLLLGKMKPKIRVAQIRVAMLFTAPGINAVSPRKWSR